MSNTDNDSAEVVDFLDELQMKHTTDAQAQQTLQVRRFSHIFTYFHNTRLFQAPVWITFSWNAQASAVQESELPNLDSMQAVKKLNTLLEDQPIDI